MLAFSERKRPVTTPDGRSEAATSLAHVYSSSAEAPATKILCASWSAVQQPWSSPPASTAPTPVAGAMEALLSRLPDEALLLALSWSGLKGCSSAACASRALKAHTRTIFCSPDLVSRALLAEFGPNSALRALGSAIGQSLVHRPGAGGFKDPSDWAHFPALQDDAALSATLGELLPLVGAGDNTSPPEALAAQPPAAGNASGAQQGPAQRLEAAAVGSLLCAAAAAGYARVADVAVRLLLRLPSSAGPAAVALGQSAWAGTQPPSSAAAAVAATAVPCYLGSALLAAARGGHAAVVELLLRAGADPNAPACSCGGNGCGGIAGGDAAAPATAAPAGNLPSGGKSSGCYVGHLAAPAGALMQAAHSGHIDVVKLLLDAGAQVDGGDAAATAGVFTASAAAPAVPSLPAFGGGVRNGAAAAAASLATPVAAPNLWPGTCHAPRGTLPPAPALSPPSAAFMGSLLPSAGGAAATAPAAALPPLPSLLTLGSLRAFPPPAAVPLRPPQAASVAVALQLMAAASSTTGTGMPQTPAAPPPGAAAAHAATVATAQRPGAPALRAAVAAADDLTSRVLPSLPALSTLPFPGARGTDGASMLPPAPPLLPSASPPATPPSPLLAACRAGHTETVELLLRRGAKVEGAGAASVLLAATSAVPASAAAPKSVAARSTLASRFPPVPFPVTVAEAAASAAARHAAAGGMFAEVGAAAAAAGGGGGTAAPRSMFESDGDDDDWNADSDDWGAGSSDGAPATPDQHTRGPISDPGFLPDGRSQAGVNCPPKAGALQALLAARPLELSRHLGPALVAAAASNRGAAVEALIAAGADVGGADGAAALKEAAYQGHLGVLQQLLAAGGARLVASGGVRAALQLAMQWGRAAAADALSRHLNHQSQQQQSTVSALAVAPPLYF